MLLPIYAYANDITSSKSTHSLKLYQSLHDVIAYAGWLSVLVRLSPAIVSIDWTAPGDRYSMDQANSCHDAYVNSKVAIIRQDMDSGEFEARSRQVMSAARVKISVTPKIVRHKPVPKTVAARGVTSYTIMKPHVVYYQGYRLEKEEKQAFISLPDYIKQLRDRNCVPLNIATVCLFVTLVTLIWVGVFHTTLGQETWQTVQRWVHSERLYGYTPLIHGVWWDLER